MEYIGTILKATLSFFTLWGITRILGRKQVGQLTMFDYITGITIGSLTASLVIEKEWGLVLAGLLVWGLLPLLMHLLDLKGRSLHRVLDGTPAIVIRNGNIVEKELKANQINVQELMALLREKGYFSLDEVEFAILETNGKISILPKSQYRPAQPRDLCLATRYEGLMIQVIQEGRIIDHGLKQAKVSQEWLQGELARQQVEPEQVFAAWLDTQGRLLVDRYDTTRH